MHPKSLSTAGVFASTFILSFLIVTVDQALPCPARTRGHLNRADDSHRNLHSSNHKDATKSCVRGEKLHKRQTVPQAQ